MLDSFDFFGKTPPMRGFRGDTFPLFRVPVEWNYPLTGCTMVVMLEPKHTPGTVVLTKNMNQYTSQEETGFSVQLDSEETANLSGVYNVYFVMTDTNDNEYKKLAGTLEVLDFPEVT